MSAKGARFPFRRVVNLRPSGLLDVFTALPTIFRSWKETLHFADKWRCLQSNIWHFRLQKRTRWPFSPEIHDTLAENQKILACSFFVNFHCQISETKTFLYLFAFQTKIPKQSITREFVWVCLKCKTIWLWSCKNYLLCRLIFAGLLLPRDSQHRRRHHIRFSEHAQCRNWSRCSISLSRINPVW